MCAYNRTNGEPCCADKTLMTDILRKEWGSTGMSSRTVARSATSGKAIASPAQKRRPRPWLSKPEPIWPAGENTQHS